LTTGERELGSCLDQIRVRGRDLLAEGLVGSGECWSRSFEGHVRSLGDEIDHDADDLLGGQGSRGEVGWCLAEEE